MRAAFAVIVAGEPGAVPQHVAAMLREAQPPAGVGFTAEGHLAWNNSTESVLVGAWRGHSPQFGPVTWQVDEYRLAVVTGELRRRGSEWSAPDRWPALLHPLIDEVAGLADELDALAGVFAGLVLDAAGNGYAVTDPFGQRSLFVAECRTHCVVASNAALAAWAVSDEEARPALDPVAVCGLAYTKHRIGERTGFAGVESLPVGDVARIDSVKGVTIVTRSPPWLPTDDLAAMTDAELIDEAQAAIGEELVAALTFPTEVTLVDLTGGKDSRLVLGALLVAGLADQCVFRTDGSPRTPDVIVAKELSEAFGLRWLSRTDMPGFYREHLDPSLNPPPNATGYGTTWTERVRYHVSATTGICNLWHAKAMTGNPRAARIGGLSGERLRSSLNFVAEDDFALVRRFDRHFGHLDLLSPDAFRRYRHGWLDELFGERYAGSSLNERHDAFLVNTLMRANFGPREELTPIYRLMPLASPRAVRAAYALRAGGRSTETIHRTIITRASLALAEHRFVDGVWQELKPAPGWATPRRGFRRRKLVDGYPPRTDRPAVDRPASSKQTTNVAGERRQVEGSSERVALLDEVLSDRGNAAWDLIDRAAAAEATARYDQLPRAAQVELMGVATAALWLADGPGW